MIKSWSSKSSSAGRIIGINNPQQAVFPAVCFSLRSILKSPARLVYTSYVACTDLSFTVSYEATEYAKQHYGIIKITTVPSNATTGTVTVTPYGSWRPAIIRSVSSNGNTTTVKFYCKDGISNGLMTVATVTHPDGITYSINANINNANLDQVVVDKTLRKNQ